MKKFLFFICVITGFLLFSFNNTAVAVVAYPFPIEFRQPDGKLITITLKGDERLSWAISSDGFTLMNNGKKGWTYATLNSEGDIVPSDHIAHNPSDRDDDEENFIKALPRGLHYSKQQIANANVILKSSTSTAVFTPQGPKKLIMILIQFPDQLFKFSKSDFQGLMNTPGYNQNGANGSVRDFFLEMSYNNFNLTTGVAGVYTADHEMAYYGADEGSNHSPKAGKLIEEAILKADPDVDFSQYDNDGDGSVDGVYVVFSGYGQADSGITDAIWPHAGTIPSVTCDGKSVSKYSCSGEFRGSSSTGELTTIGVICHEFGHVCGAPDYYDTDYDVNGEFPGTGNWDLMCSGCYNGTPAGAVPSHFNPFEKVRAGWVTPEPLSASRSLTIPDITTNPSVYILNTDIPNEYFMMENRQQTGFNSYCPGHGLMIYHYSKYYWDLARNKTAPQGFYPICANSVTNPTPTSSSDSYGNINSTGCPFPGSSNKVAFYDATIPSSKSWAGANTNIPITDIKENPDGSISLKVSKDNNCTSAPGNQASALVISSVTNNSMNLSWTRGNGDKVLVVARAGGSVDFDPVNGTAYVANSTFKSGDEIGYRNYVVYNGTGNSVAISGLKGGGSYYYSIYEYNSADNCYKKSGLTGNETTNCLIDAASYIERFEDDAWGCWTVVDNTGQGSWQLGTTSTVNYTPGLSGNYAYLKCEYGAAHNYNTDLISPTFDLSGYKNVAISFKHLFDASSYYSSTGKVFYSSDNGVNWTQIASYTSDQVDQQVTIPIDAAAGKSQVKFKWNYTCSPTGAYMWAVDDFQVVDNSVFWTGTTDSDWFKGTNWSSGSVPSTSACVVIPSAPVNQPQINASGAECQNIRIENGASLTMNGTTSYTVSVSGNWVNEGTFAAGKGVVNFNGSSDLQTISGTSTTNFNVLSVSKGAQSRILEAISLITLSGATNPLVLNSGTFKLSSSSTIVPFTTDPDFATTAGLWNNGGTINSNNLSWTFRGLLKITSGIINVGPNSNVSLIYWNGGQVVVEGGTLNVAGQFRGYSTASAGSYRQTGGIVNLNTSGSTSTSRAPLELNSAVPFTMSGGTIVIQKSSSNLAADIVILSATNAVTGGTIQFGNESTTGSPVIRINSTAPIYNLTVNGNGTPTGKIITNNLAVKNNVTLNSGSKLDLNGLNLSVGGNWINNNGVIVGTSTGTVTFNGISAQSIGGSAGTTFNDLVVDTETGVTTASGITTIVNNNLTINSGKKLIVSPGSNLTAANLANNSDATGLAIKSDVTGTGSIIVGTTAATATFASYLTGNKWHIVTPAVSGGSVSGFIQNPTNSIPSKDVSGNLSYGMMSYNEATNLWNEYYKATTTDNLNNGQGYGLRRSGDGVVTYAGAIASGSKTVSLTNTKDGWNCIGNPYTSAISMNSAANTTTDNFLKANAIDASNLDPAYACIYLWDDQTKIYKILGNVDYSGRNLGQNVFSAGQGFFVKAKSAGSQIVFNPQMQLHSSGIQLKSAGQPWPGFALDVRSGDIKASTAITFNNQMTNGLDPTYDAGLLRGSSGLEVFSRLVDDNGIDFAVQCLPDADFSKLVIPVGVESKQGGNIVFSIDALNLPVGCSVILEDKLTRKFTDLTASNYQTTVEAGTGGHSRFQIHTSHLTTGIKEGDLAGESKLVAYAVGNSEIRIQGSVNERGKASLFDVSGRMILMDNLEPGMLNIIHCQPLKTGVYLLLVKDSGTEKVFKIIVK